MGVDGEEGAGAPRSFGEAEDRLRSGRAEADKGGVRITAGRSRGIQAVRSGTRKLFRGKLRQEFLEWFAATANVKWSADRVGIAYQTVWKNRMRDPVFAEEFERALEQGAARVRAKLIETRACAKPAEIGGDYDAPELEEVDPQVALTVLREHGFGVSGRLPGGRPAKQGRAPRVASNEEVHDALVKRLAVFGLRVSGERE